MLSCAKQKCSGVATICLVQVVQDVRAFAHHAVFAVCCQVRLALCLQDCDVLWRGIAAPYVECQIYRSLKCAACNCFYIAHLAEADGGRAEASNHATYGGLPCLAHGFCSILSGVPPYLPDHVREGNFGRVLCSSGRSSHSSPRPAPGA